MGSMQRQMGLGALLPDVGCQEEPGMGVRPLVPLGLEALGTAQDVLGTGPSSSLTRHPFPQQGPGAQDKAAG